MNVSILMRYWYRKLLSLGVLNTRSMYVLSKKIFFVNRSLWHHLCHIYINFTIIHKITAEHISWFLFYEHIFTAWFTRILQKMQYLKVHQHAEAKIWCCRRTGSKIYCILIRLNHSLDCSYRSRTNNCNI